MTVSNERYTSIAIILHWVMAIAFILMLASGLSMEYLELPKSLKFNLFQWHKSLGLILLVAFVIRLTWRLFHKPPALHESMPDIEQLAAKTGHWLLYGFMLAVPLTGWAMVSSSVYGLPTIVFGLFEWPHIPNIAGNETINNLAKSGHWILAWAFGTLILGHIAAVIKHYFFEHENLLTRMWWTKGE